MTSRDDDVRWWPVPSWQAGAGCWWWWFRRSLRKCDDDDDDEAGAGCWWWWSRSRLMVAMMLQLVETFVTIHNWFILERVIHTGESDSYWREWSPLPSMKPSTQYESHESGPNSCPSQIRFQKFKTSSGCISQTVRARALKLKNARALTRRGLVP